MGPYFWFVYDILRRQHNQISRYALVAPHLHNHAHNQLARLDVPRVIAVHLVGVVVDGTISLVSQYVIVQLLQQRERDNQCQGSQVPNQEPFYIIISQSHTHLQQRNELRHRQTQVEDVDELMELFVQHQREEAEHIVLGVLDEILLGVGGHTRTIKEHTPAASLDALALHVLFEVLVA